jgi:hypothetical protein
MNKEILEEKVYYYPDGVTNFTKLMSTIDEVDLIENESNSSLWLDWTASNDKEFIYGVTKTFDINEINKLEEPLKSKMTFIYNTVNESFYNVCKDYAKAMGDNDEPRLFPTFNIKKYQAGIGMGSHYDQLDGDKTLRYSLVMYLNDDCEGGEISFQLKDYDGGWTSADGFSKGSAPAVDLDYDISVANKAIDFGLKPKANSVIIFPAFPPYFHTAHIVKSGFKYMIPSHWIHNEMDLNKSQGM